MRRPRFVIECEWSGYRASQRRICHRAVETRHIEAYRAIHTIAFTDGTTMRVSVRQCKPREKVKEIRGYPSLLRDAVTRELTGYISVNDLLVEGKRCTAVTTHVVAPTLGDEPAEPSATQGSAT